MTERRVLCSWRAMSGALLLTVGLMAMPAMADHPACAPGAGDCCTDTGSQGCDDPVCCHDVCTDDAFCCDVVWDDICAGTATGLCPKLCGNPPPPGCDNPGDTTLSQSTSLDVIALSGVACGLAGLTTENYWARTYLMDADLAITCVTFGIETNSGGAPHPGHIAIYLDTNGGAPQNPDIDLKLLGLVDIEITDPLALYTGNFDPPVNVSAGDQIVVELFVSQGQTSVPPTGIWPGANGSGQSGPTYIRADPCGIFEYADLAAVGEGFPNSHLVNAINGNEGGDPPCPWDLDGSGAVGTNDLLLLFAQWGQVGTPADFDGGGVSTSDLLILFANWGLCP
ncbi:MAG: hypothetical protein IH984_16985 [Planctomycetes bacterium]|nr:hypothetical protein [Planctomycetota bacterium]